jgi:hypothetical protein
MPLTHIKTPHRQPRKIRYREALNKPPPMRGDRIGMGCKSDFAGNLDIDKKSNAADRPNPGDRALRGLV